MARRRRASWMRKGTDDILELLDELDVAVSSGAIIYELRRNDPDPIGESTVYRALDALEDREYIQRPRGEDTKLIEITERGREYLRGERDARDDE